MAAYIIVNVDVHDSVVTKTPQIGLANLGPVWRPLPTWSWSKACEVSEMVPVVEVQRFGASWGS